MVTRQLQVERRTAKVRRPKTDVLPLCLTQLCEWGDCNAQALALLAARCYRYAAEVLTFIQWWQGDVFRSLEAELKIRIRQFVGDENIRSFVAETLTTYRWR